MANTSVQLYNPENPEQLWFPVTLAELVQMPSGSSLLVELGKYLKQKESSSTDAPYVQEVSVNEAGTQLQVKTWSKTTDGVLTSQSIDIVGANTTYVLSASFNRVGEGVAGSKLILSGSDGVITETVVPVGALVNDDNVELILDGRFN